jgi:DNA segregation ATPase FtsK/SpoIIIE, S-DNA-T family
MLSASVSEIHLCHRCSRLLAYQLSGSKKAWKVGLSGTGEMPGAFFHDRIAAPFYKTVASGGNTKIFRELVGILNKTASKNRQRHLLAFLEKYFFIPIITKHAKYFQSVRIISLGHGFAVWNRFLSDFFNQFDPTKEKEGWKSLLKKLVHDPETLIGVKCKLDKKTMLRVTGRYDALMLNPDKGEAVLVEFKGRKAGTLDEDFLQVALYAWIFKQKTGISPVARVIYLEENEPEIFYDSNILSGVDPYLPGLFRRVASIIEAVPRKERITLPSPLSSSICHQCPFDQICDSDWGKRHNYITTNRNRQESSVLKNEDRQNGDPTLNQESSPENLEEANEGLRNLCSAFESLRMPVEAMGYIIGPRFIRYKVKPILEQGSTAKKLKNQAENIQVELGLSTAPMVQPQAGFVSVDVPRENNEPLTLGKVWRIGAKNRPHSVVAFPMGMAIDGNIFWADLTDPNMTGILVGGASGSGKSVFLRSVVIGLALNASPENIRITLIDPKRVSFTDLEDLPHLAGPVVMDDDSAINTLDHLIDEMEQRYRLFEEKKVRDIGRFNQVSKPIPHHVVIIDEYGDLMVHKDKKADLERSVRRLGQKGRAAGIHIVLATQRPDAKVVTPIIKANLALKVALKVATASNSSIILDQSGAEYLIGMGDMLIGGSLYLERLQGPLVTGTEIRMAMSVRSDTMP